MGADPPHGTGPGKISKWSCKEDNRETTKETRGGGLGITNAGFSNGGGGILGDRGLYPKEAEHGHAVNYDMSDSGTLQEDGAEARKLGGSEMIRKRGKKSSGCEGVGDSSRGG